MNTIPTDTIPAFVTAQRKYFNTGATKSLEFRKTQLRKVISLIQKNEEKIFAALKSDLHKSAGAAFISEIVLTLDEAKFAITNLDRWAKPARVRTALSQMVARTYIHSDPLGVVLIIAPWNYPFQLVFGPLIGAIAAGNCSVLKPSELAPATAEVISKLVRNEFSPEHVAVVQGGVEESTVLLNERWDHIFFTGGTAVGKVVMAAAAKHLTPVTLELGGKSPCIIDKEVDLEVAARRIAWGKFFNAGQTCIAPDYLMVPRGMRDTVIRALEKNVETFFGKEPIKSPDYARIISDRHYKRLKGFLGGGKVAFGGHSVDSDRYLSPTVLTDVSWQEKVMQEEIFGPLLPVFEYSDLKEVINVVQGHEKPLALYFFSSNACNQDRILSELTFGGGCINDTLTHLASLRVPFGGVGESGMGNYHGKYSFDTFSHKKTILRKAFFPDFALRYPPYEKKLSLLRKLLG